MASSFQPQYVATEAAEALSIPKPLELADGPEKSLVPVRRYICGSSLARNSPKIRTSNARFVVQNLRISKGMFIPFVIWASDFGRLSNSFCRAPVRARRSMVQAFRDRRTVFQPDPIRPHERVMPSSLPSGSLEKLPRCFKTFSRARAPLICCFHDAEPGLDRSVTAYRSLDGS